ncbi:Na(+)-translocating NADH-quinone reductase subunit C [Myxococcota bacterium]|nr:Na(+)-translocating NADH-quinone reductase subunit C [Myxococcota bacterium]MBU1430809.1 Na(+)-translocating NADH-quinone reductase subunit C [Myxococcota bacterium]MBU1899665.1 Na(+)-translocating NADH-quinone reductase subunit C [Myxococcota bacterium]
MGYSTKYIIGFAGAVCLVCSVLVSGAAVALKDRQEANKVLDRQQKVLSVAGLLEGKSLSPEEIQGLFSKRIQARVVDLKTGEYADMDAASFDQRKATKEPSTSQAAPANLGGIARVPKHALIYQLVAEGDPKQVELLILPITGKGLWSTLYGFLALAPDTNTIKGITFYEHGETPGLGGEIENKQWTDKWVGRKAFTADWAPAIEVIKGAAGTPEATPHKIDGLSGATLTGRGVTYLVQFWLGEHGFGAYLTQLRAKGSKS